jgi:phage shock protein PspC (stress-responsive transcriptional regulator)
MVMKKNISINISGIIFHIEEDGYERLKSYLESINKYFSALDDSGEIVSDIENRIAEIFLSKLKDGKQVITAEDVEELIATMGSVEDFEAEALKQEVEEEEKFQRQQAYTGTYTATATTEPKRLFRDMKRRLLGGVCSGIAYYFKIDPIWIRLLFIVLFLDLFFSSTVGTLTLIAYIVLWIVVPPAYELEDDTKIRKMFRDPENRVIGGVSSGLAAYFGADSNVLRLLFVILAFFGGTGIIAYLILWIITPEARTLTDRMQMQGEPLTLSNIEHNIKKSFNVKEDEEESPLVKVLLFPFRLIAIILETVGKILGPLLQFLGEAVRVIFGLVLVICGFALLAGLLGTTIALVQDYPEWSDFGMTIQGVPMDVLRKSIPTATSVSGLFALGIPALALVILGMAVVLKRSLINNKIGWSAFALWLIAAAVFGFSFYPAAMQFEEEASFKKTVDFDLHGKPAVLRLNWAGMEDYEVAKLKIRGHSRPVFTLVETFKARGRSHAEAIDNAQMVDYQVMQQDSILLFDSNISFQPDSKFRAQELDMTLYVPYNYPFKMEEEMTEIIRSTLGRYGIRSYELGNNTFMFIDNELKCITCEDYQKEEYYSKIDKNPYNYDIHALPENFAPAGYQRSESFEDFQAVEVEDVIQANIQQGNDFKVTVSGEQKWVERTEVQMRGKKLLINVTYPQGEQPSGDQAPVKVNITMPELHDLELRGRSRAIVRGFETEDMRFSLDHYAFADVAVNSREIVADMTGNSTLDLKGTGKFLLADLTEDARLRAYNFNSRNAELELKEEAAAEVRARYKLNVEAYDNSRVTYRGNPDVDIMGGNSRSVQRD